MTENPFPGMNPYLEDPRLWSGVHHGFIATLRADLNDSLPEQATPPTSTSESMWSVRIRHG
jgi:hypothetical protein